MIFIIHSKQLLNDAIVLERELGKPCYIPGRDTPQTHGDSILKDNLKGMLASEDEVYVIWDGGSMGTLFDMGMAYALKKKIIPYKMVGGRNWSDYFKSNLGGAIQYVE